MPCPHWNESCVPPVTDSYTKNIMDNLAGEYVNYRLICLFNTSSRKRWLKTYDGSFCDYNSVISRFRKIPRLIKKFETGEPTNPKTHLQAQRRRDS
jgi:hypothetical protein